MTPHVKLDGCIVWNAHNTVLGEEVLLIYIIPVCYVKTGIERASNIIISLHDRLREDFKNFVPKGFMRTQKHVLCANFVKIWLTGNR